ncbi:methyl-accepting chemotaxis protein [Candidatus Clostridium stratigraminis]|uniref:Methyl-accepting chemotaxis protein n=1 Tax=Candidatus Clostridium stratigraminis TaxID=3381661 RepID=A0ABW8T0M7_9CLOT
MRISLKAKLSLIFFLLISIPLVSLGVFSYFKSSGALQSISEQNLNKATSLTAESIVGSIKSVNDSLEFISLSDSLVTVLENPNEENKIKAFKYISQIQKNKNSEIETLLVVNKTGKSIMTNEKQNDDTDLSDREYVQKALKGTSAQSDVITSKITGNTVVGVAFPVMKDNKLLGVVVGTIKFETISQHAAEIKVGESGYAYMLNKDGVFIYHPDSQKVLKENFFNTNDKNIQVIVEGMKSGKAGSGEYTYEGVRKFVAYASVNGWILATTANYDELMSSAINIRNYTIYITLGAIFVAMIIAYFLTTNNIIKPIKNLEELMSKAGDGDLTVKSHISTKDEIQVLGESFNKMIESQVNIIKKVSSASQELSASSEEMAASSEEITASVETVTASIQGVAADTEKQKDTILDTSQVLVQLSSLIQIAQNKAFTTSDNATRTVEAANAGRNKVKETVSAINTISRTTDETENILKSVEELSKKVEGITTTINSISSQTNLLALNAAIEAARAGEHGKGFSVVADEVRVLSEQTALGSNEISQLINEMVKQIELAVKSMAIGKASVDNGVVVVNETDKSFLSIINSIERIVEDIGQVVEVTKEEVANSDQIIKLIDTIATLAEQNFSSSQEVASSAEEQTASVENLSASATETSTLAYELNNIVEKFKVWGEQIEG